MPPRTIGDFLTQNPKTLIQDRIPRAIEGTLAEDEDDEEDGDDEREKEPTKIIRQE